MANETVTPTPGATTATPSAPEPSPPLAPDAATGGAEAEPTPEAPPPSAIDEAKVSEAAKTLAEKKNSFRQRIDMLRKETGDLERRAIAAEQRVAQLEERAAKRPDPAQYTDPAKYEYDDRAAQAADLRRHEVKLEAEDIARQAALAQVQVWQARCEDYAAEVPDFEEVTGNPNVPISTSMAQVLLDMEDGPAVAYHLAKNPTSASRISRLTPRQQSIELGKIAGQLAQVPPPRRVTQAPPPPATVQGRSGAPTADIRKMSMEEYAAHRSAQLKASKR
jgi:hypothetical protein